MIKGCTIQNTDFCLNGATCAPGQGFTDYGPSRFNWNSERTNWRSEHLKSRLWTSKVSESLIQVGYVRAKKVTKEFAVSKQNVIKQWLYRGKPGDASTSISLSWKVCTKLGCPYRHFVIVWSVVRIFYVVRSHLAHMLWTISYGPNNYGPYRKIGTIEGSISYTA